MSADPSVEVSIVVSTFNRCELLSRTLDSLLQQNGGSPRFELIVVDNNSSDRTAQVLAEYARRDRRIRTLFEPRQGVSFGRNAGIAVSRAPIVAFTDDDLLVAPDWTAQVKQTLDAHAEVDYVGGKVLPAPTQHFPPWLTRVHWNPVTLRDPGETPFYLNSQTPICMGSGNLAIRREVLLAFDGFSPAFPRGQDRELQLRLWRAGRQGLYVPGLVVYAEIQPERLSKAYHRRWYTGDGQLSATIQDEEVERSRARLFDVPAHLYRQALIAAGRLCWLSLLGRRSAAFLAELELRYFLGFYRQRRRDFLDSGRQGSFANFAVFLRDLWKR